MLNTLKIAQLNANGLSQRSHEVTKFINLHKLDIVLISETHFTTRSYLRIPHYSIYSTEHPDGTAHGGTAVIITNSIKHNVYKQFRNEHIQATNVYTEDWSGPLAISAVYSPPRHTIKEEQYSAFFNALGNRFIAGGDNNAKHQQCRSRLATSKAVLLVKSIDKNKLNHLSTGEQNLDLSSEHSHVMINLNSNIINKDKPVSLRNKATNWSIFRELLEERTVTDVPLHNADNMDEAVEALTRTIQKAAWDSTPTQIMSTKS